MGYSFHPFKESICTPQNFLFRAQAATLWRLVDGRTGTTFAGSLSTAASGALRDSRLRLRLPL